MKNTILIICHCFKFIQFHYKMKVLTFNGKQIFNTTKFSILFQHWHRSNTQHQRVGLCLGIHEYMAKKEQAKGKAFAFPALLVEGFSVARYITRIGQLNGHHGQERLICNDLLDQRVHDVIRILNAYLVQDLLHLGGNHILELGKMNGSGA